MAKNKYIKTANEEVEYTPEQIAELKKCKKDPIYFIEKYVKIVHPTLGAVNFELYDYQRKLIRNYVDHKDNIVLSARQTGKSITSAAYLLWFASFHFDKTVLIASNKEDGAKEMVLRIRFAYENLPMWLKPGIVDDGWNKHNIGFDNGSRIVSTATSENSGRGLSISLLYLDEFAFVNPTIQEEFWTSIAPTLSTGGNCIITSTPNGDMNLFAQLWRGAELETNGFKSTWVKWDEPPGRDDAFKQEQIGKLGERKWTQEYECVFLSSDALLIDSLALANETPRLESIVPLKEIKGIKFFKEIDMRTTYLIGVDPSTGSGEDYSVITGYEFPNMEQVLEFRSNSMSSKFVYTALKNIVKYLENQGCTVYFSVENNGVGEGVIALYDADERPPEQAVFVSETGKDRYGFATTPKSKMRACVSFKEMFERNKLTINSLILLKELKSFVRKRGAYEAQIGATDDSISASLIVLRILEHISTYDQDAFNTLYSFDDEDWFGSGDESSFNENDPDQAPMPMVF